jgi:hypothetical protein
MEDFFQPHIVAIAIISIVFIILTNLTRSNIASTKASIIKKKHELEAIEIDEVIIKLKAEIKSIEVSIEKGEAVFNTLKAPLDESQMKYDLIELGLVPPTFSFDDSESIKEKIEECQLEQYKIVTASKATDSLTNWTWFESRDKGQKMVDAYCHLLLKAFNAEFDFIRKQMRYASFEAAKTKFEKLLEQLAKLGETASVSISWDYANLKFKELQIWHNELIRKEKIKQEKKKHKELLRNQSKEFGHDNDELEDDLYYRESDLAKAKMLAKKLHGNQLAMVDLEVRQLQKEIALLEQKFTRATSQAEITKVGYIYVISNIGSFGAGVVKIGMTRRLEPMDRVNELGDASVPFKFDVHTLAFVNNAPHIEKTLHRKFNAMRVNKDNNRKEFFKVSPSDVRAAMNELKIEADWFFDIEAKEYRESLLIREASHQSSMEEAISYQLPETI